MIAPEMFRINPFKPSKEQKYVPNKVRASVRINPTTVSQPHDITKKDVNSDSNSLSSTGVDNTAKTKSMNSHDKKQKSNVSNTKNQKKQNLNVMKPKKVRSNERIASPKPSKPRSCLRWSPIGRLFDLKGKIIASSEFESQSDCSNGDNACTSNHPEPTIKRFLNFTSFLGRLSKFVYGTVHFGNDHVAVILGFDDLQWGNILITRVYFVKGLGHNLFSIGQFYDSDLEKPQQNGVVVRRNRTLVEAARTIVYNRRTKKIMETMNVTFDELYAMAFKQSSSKLGLQSMTSRQISLGLNLTYAPSTITTQQPTEGEFDLLFEAMYDDYIDGQSSATPRTALAAQAS
nr:hypothetical protein [Tanacetum cinerariifolium]